MNSSHTSSPYRLLTKKRLPVSIRFSLRPSYATVQIRITIDGQAGSAFSSLPSRTTLSSLGATWNQGLQRATGRSEADRLFNQQLDRIRVEISTVYERQKQTDLLVTPKTVQYEFQTGVAGGDASTKQLKESRWSVANCYRTYLHDLKTGKLPEKVLVQTTLNKWAYGLTYLETYVTQNPDAMSSSPADELSLFWGKSYHRWLMKEGPMSADSATRYVRRLIEAITYIAESGRIKTNPLSQLSLSRAKTKDVHFLEAHHLEKFWRLDLKPGRTKESWWWMGIIFLTGLDYPDAVRYVANREAYERTTKEGGKKIVINRSKPPKTECHIPMSTKLIELLEQQPAGTPPTDGYWVNDEMKAVEVLIGFEHRLTCKVGRKTAGSIFFADYEDIEAVSKMLGHSSIAISERYYVKTTSYTVDKAMQKKGSAIRIEGTPFSHIYKAC